ncbi:restriction endonuclease subunit S [Komagataeibacter nataicola]|uniref:restriction endonuclease subunit S n=1 Tax=Komagataeibacter nataicola TaxID=265960 RepID=UPI0023DD1362|nr:restriction endonuclease subunit S [Komagataeibacter nataicola]WEQ55289.1 restriction endonuclease subunit S [Komagataeibacter nataicola]
MLPEGWKRTTFEDHIDLLSGNPFKSAEYSNDPTDIRLLRGDNIEPGKLRWRDAKFWPTERIHNLTRYSLQQGDFVIAMDRTWVSSGLKVAEVRSADLPCLLVQRVSRIRALPTLCQSLLKQYFSGYSFENYVKSVETETAVPHISAQQIKDFPFLLPPLPEQKKIAAILSTWDRAIEGTEKLLANSQQQKKALMQQLLTGKKRLPGFTGEWKNIALGELEKKGFLELGRGNVISKKDIAAHPGQNPIYSSSVKNCGLMGTYGHYMFDEELISWSVDGGGHFFHRKKHKFSITNVSGYMRVDQKNLNYKFLCSQLQFLHEKLHFDYQTKAHPSVIRDLYILNTPPLAEQKAIAAVLTTADEEITALESDLSHLRQEKKALIQQLLTGKRRVTVD